MFLEAALKLLRVLYIWDLDVLYYNIYEFVLHLTKNKNLYG